MNNANVKILQTDKPMSQDDKIEQLEQNIEKSQMRSNMVI